MTREQALAELRECATMDDAETAHIEADDVLCELLCALGYNDVVEVWGQVPKWYA